MKKNFLMISLMTLTFTGVFVACEKEKTEPVKTETEAESTIDDSEREVIDNYVFFQEKFPTRVEKEEETRRLMSKYIDQSQDRDDCFDAAWEYGTLRARSAVPALEEHFGSEIPAESLAWLEWYYTNEYYSTFCESHLNGE